MVAAFIISLPLGGGLVGLSPFGGVREVAYFSCAPATLNFLPPLMMTTCPFSRYFVLFAEFLEEIMKTFNFNVWERDHL
jgi:hypothetical protein